MRQGLYRQIADDLRGQIASGVYKPGDKLPTEMELARTYGVSRGSSAQALGALAREGLVQRAPRRGTIVSAFPRPVPSESQRLIAWLQPDIDHSIGLDLLRGIDAAAREAGYQLLFRLTGASQAAEQQIIRDVLAVGTQGLALFLQDGEAYNAEVLRLVIDRFPLVLVDRYLRGLDCASVQCDHLSAARDLVAELLGAGHRRICAMLFPPKDTSTIEDCLEGYTQALDAASLPLDRKLLYIEEHFEENAEEGFVPVTCVERFAAYVRARPEITAIFASNAALALLALRACDQVGLRIPDDLSLTCIDAVQSYPLTLPTVTCALQPSVAIGRTAVELLREQLQGQPPRRVTLPMRIERAGSVAPPRVRVAI